MSTNSQLSFGVSSTLITDGTIVNADISSSAAISTSKISGLATSATTDTTNAANITSGTLAAARMPALTGDITTTAGAVATTLATVNSNVGSFGSSTAVPVITVNAKGLITAISTSNISGSISVTGGDLTMSGATGTAITNATLATVNSNVGTYNNVTVNAKGLVTAASNVSYLTSYSETDTLSSVTGRGASTSTNITLSGGTTTLSNATSNTITSGTDVNLFINTRDSSAAATGAVQIRSGSTTFANSTAGTVSIYAGQSTSATGANVSITGGDVNTATSTAGYVNIRGGTALTGASTAGTGGAVFISGGYAYASAGTKTGGHVYLEGGAPFNAGTNVNGNVYVGTNAGILGQTATAAVYIGSSAITTTISGTVKLPTVGTSGFVKLGAGGQLSADTNTYLTTNQSISISGDASGSGTTAITLTLATVNSNVGTYNNVTVNAKGLVTAASNVSYLTAEADTLATVTGRGNSTSTNIGSTSGTALALATTGNVGTWIGGISDGTSGWALSQASIGFKSDNTTYAAIGIGTANGILYFGRTTASGVGTMSSWLEVDSGGVANFKRARPQHNGSNLALVSEIPSLSGYLTSESDTLATVTARGATTSSTVSFTGASKLGIQGANDGSSNYGIFLWQTSDTNWGIYMSTSGASKSLASGTAPASIDGRTSHHVRFRSGQGSGNGFIWESAQNETTVMSLATDTGSLYVKGSYYVGGSTTTYVTRNSTTGCMEFYV